MQNLESLAQSGSSATDALEPHVTIRGLSKSFADGKVVIYDNFDFDIPRGKVMTIFGPNGCGKSTLINMIADLLPRDAGEILIDGRTVKDSRIGYVLTSYIAGFWRCVTDCICGPLGLDSPGRRCSAHGVYSA